MNRTWSTVLIAAVVATSLGACGRASRTVAPENTAPVPTSPGLAVKALEWAFVNRDVDVLAELLSDDMLFATAGLDSAGNPSRVEKDRAWLLACAENMFNGTAEHPPASSITLAFDRNLIPLPDLRPGHADSLFKTIRTSLDLKVVTGDGNTFEVTGFALFYLVRGDVAAIPKELIARGFLPDRNRWWIWRWEDETLEGSGATGASAHPTKSATFGRILELYSLRERRQH